MAFNDQQNEAILPPYLSSGHCSTKYLSCVSIVEWYQTIPRRWIRPLRENTHGKHSAKNAGNLHGRPPDKGVG